MKKRNVIKLSITVVLLIALTCWVNSVGMPGSAIHLNLPTAR